MELFITTLVAGITVGCIYGLIALALCTIFNVSELVNFGQGHMAMLGAFAGSLFIFTRGWPLFIGIIAIIVFSVICALGFHYFLSEPFLRRGAPILTPILALLGGALFLEGAIGVWTGFSHFNTEFIFGREPLVLGLFKILPQYAVIIIAAAVLTALYWFLLYKTNLGLAIRGTGIDSETASIMGVNLSRVRLAAYIISGIIAGFAGFLIAPLVMPSALIGFPWVISGFIAATFGGFGSPFAALGGGLAIGLITKFFAAYVSPGNATLLMFLAMLMILAFRPEGLFIRK